MATGSGKTIVMGMVIAWAFCNRGRDPATREFPSAVLVCAPNLTVKGRLQVLRPDAADNYYDAFDLVPAKYRELLNAGKVLVTNWHGFAPKSPHREGDTTYRVVDKGEETPEAFAKDRLGELSARLPILVLNDEGHHCWRPRPGMSADPIRGLTKEEKEVLEEEVEEVRVWLAGLDRINNAGLLGHDKPCVLATVDLSATPFYLGNSGYPEGSPFPWLVSDFGLVDAIECGIVKIPRLPVKDTSGTRDEAGRPDPKFFRLWKHINDGLAPAERLASGRPKPDAVYREAQAALVTLASQWQQRLDEIVKASPGETVVPPVLVVVCDNTEIAEVVYREISGEKAVEVPTEDGRTVQETVYEGSRVFPELSNREGLRRTVRIDSKLLAKAEVEEGTTRDQAALALREVINTVGKRGQPGEHVRCVVSVSMLTEGWDASNVTHILGLRAFASQLLCEQVVGRGLRRMSYTPDPETGKLPAEYVDVYGSPFCLIPFKGKEKEWPDTDPVYHHVYALEEREALEIRIPVVESYTYDLRGAGIRCNVDDLEGFIVKDEPDRVYLQPVRGYQDQAGARSLGDYVEQTREEYYRTVRFQQVVFRLAQIIADELVQGAQGPGAERAKRRLRARHQRFPELVLIINQYVARRLRFAPGIDRRDLALKKYADLLRQRVRDGILPAAADEAAPLVPIVNSYKPWVSSADVNYRTTRPVVPLTKIQLNLAAIHSDLECRAIETLEDLDVVACYTPNERNIGLMIPYEYGEAAHHYEPDFVVRVRGGTQVLLEIKGKKGELHDEERVLAKNAAAKKWVAAVNNAGRYGTWAFAICKDLARLRGVLEAHARPTAEVLPFRDVPNPAPADRYRTCVPLVGLRAAAGRWSEEQGSLEESGEWAEDRVTLAARSPFERGMFVARVQRRSMEPDIPDGSYCLFRPARGGSRQGRKLLVWHSGVTDPAIGGQYTLKVYTSEKAVDPETGWQHTRIVLRPLNLDFEPPVLTPEDEGEVRELAEFVEEVGPVDGEGGRE
jgi:type III restriction enzyme